MLLFIADNLACFPYQTQEEPLFIMHHIDITLSVSGSNLLQSFKEVGSFLYSDLLIFVVLFLHHETKTQALYIWPVIERFCCLCSVYGKSLYRRKRR